MSPRLGAGPWSAHVMRTVIATAGVTTLVVARAGFAMAAGPLPGASVPTPAGTPSVSAATTPSGANVTGNYTGAGPTHGTVPVNVNANTQRPSVSINSQNPSVGTSGVGIDGLPSVPDLPGTVTVPTSALVLASMTQTSVPSSWSA